jgi:hypothetical protein
MEAGTRPDRAPVPAQARGRISKRYAAPWNTPGTCAWPWTCSKERLPPAYACDGLEAELWALREKIDAAEITQLRTLGHRDYLIIQPLAPAAPGPLVTKAAQAVKTLDDLGLIIRLI